MAEMGKDKTGGRALAEPAPHLAARTQKARAYARNARSENAFLPANPSELAPVPFQPQIE
ncbi:hypothetical protein WOA01_22320 [Methylocystis sp. IM2]|jgi:hypothetical protein|uniref:hypothetical protein n=2 Tax=Methylocystis TaxID=133 RepID=UPI000FA90A37|nr:MAG: hypothetical protein EKK29_15330 [Hyphomicrobiales bacterium]